MSINKEKLLAEDGLIAEPVQFWSQYKHQLVSMYADLFVTSMRAKWRNLVYIDLMSGPGLSFDEYNNAFHESPALEIFKSRKAFDLYIFNDANSEAINALESRVMDRHPDSNSRFFNEDANDRIAHLLKRVWTKDTLMLCFLDPYNVNTLKFSTIQRLAQRRTDIIILLPTHMDIHRNEKSLLESANPALDEFLGTTKWREDWTSLNTTGVKKPEFGNFAGEYFLNQAAKLGFHYMEPIHIKNSRNRLIYKLALMSKSESLPSKFWKIAKDHVEPPSGQRDMF